MSDVSRGARSTVGGENVTEDTQDSGLSSESSTPTAGSPTLLRPKIPLFRSVKTSGPLPVPQSSLSLRRDNKSDPRIVSGRSAKLVRSRSGTESPRSLDGVRARQVPSPLRTPSSAQSPSFDSGDEGSVRIDREGYQSMFQDIVSIKTMLLKLKRVLQEADTLNPFDEAIKNGLLYNLKEGGSIDVSTSPGENNIVDELADLRRQVIFLQGQVEDRDRTIQTLRMSKLRATSGSLASPTINPDVLNENTCNAATQTEKMRPVSTGPSILQSQDASAGPFVSWSHRKALGEVLGPEERERSSCRRTRPTREASSCGKRLESNGSQGSPEEEDFRGTNATKTRLVNGIKKFPANSFIPRAARVSTLDARAHNPP